MPSNGIRRLAADRPEPVVSYSRIPPDAPAASDEAQRIEPHFTVLPLDRAPRFEEVAAPAPMEDVSPHIPRDAMAEPAPRGRRASRILVLVGVLALLAGAGVLAATFSHVVSGARVASSPDGRLGPGETAAPAVSQTDVSTNQGTGLIPASGDKSAPTQSASLPAAETTPVIEPVKPVAVPEPRLRPSLPAAIASAPPPATTVASSPVATAAIPAPAANASSDPDTDALMASVDRLLAQRKAGGWQTAAPATMQNVAVAPPGALAAGDPLQPAPLPAPPPPLGIFQDEEIPVPPADIPNGRSTYSEY